MTLDRYPPERQYASDRLPANYPTERVALVDLLDRVLAEGVVITGDITLSIADVDLVTVSLRAVLASVSALAGQVQPETRQAQPQTVQAQAETLEPE
ncbi:MAG TPA: gas vesicle protein [Trebonia sp.]